MAVSTENIIVLADVHAKSGHEAELRAVLEDAAQQIQTTDGCILCRLQEDIADKGHLVLYEVWRDTSTIDAHQSSTVFKGCLRLLSPSPRARIFSDCGPFLNNNLSQSYV